MVVLRAFLSPALLLAAWANTGPFALAQARGPRNIDDMFQVSYDVKVPGNCAGRENDFPQIVEDAFVLSEAGIQAVLDSSDENSRTRSQADRLVTAIFQNPSVEERNTILRRFKLVRNFFKRKGRILNGGTENKPYLFCSDSWRIREDMSSQMRDAGGNLMKDEKGSPYLIKDDKAMKSRQKATMKELGAAKLKHVYPYWCPNLKTYMFDKTYGDNPTQGPCSSDDKLFGYTVWETKVGIGAVVLCDKAFDGGKLRSVKPNPFKDSVFAEDDPKPPKQKTTIKSVSPQAKTFYHELFHLLWATYMDPENGEEYQFKLMAGKEERVIKKGSDEIRETFKKEQSMMNPHSYVYTAIAYDYTQNTVHRVADPSNSGQDRAYPIEFYTGYATYNA
ncbi:hypothetical protein RU639_012751 [Aspergillus parasiticus]